MENKCIINLNKDIKQVEKFLKNNYKKYNILDIDKISRIDYKEYTEIIIWVNEIN